LKSEKSVFCVGEGKENFGYVVDNKGVFGEVWQYEMVNKFCHSIIENNKCNKINAVWENVSKNRTD